MARHDTTRRDNFPLCQTRTPRRVQRPLQCARDTLTADLNRSALSNQKLAPSRYAWRRRPTRSLRQPPTAVCETPATRSHPQMSRFPAPAMISHPGTHLLARTQPHSSAGPPNLVISPATPDSLRRPRKTVSVETPRRTIPNACHEKRAPRAHDSPRRPRETAFPKPQVTRFPLLATRNARCTTSKCTIPHACHANPPFPTS